MKRLNNISRIPGVISHPNPKYSKYIYGWEDPSNPGNLISKFNVIVSDKFETDQKLLPSNLHNINKKLKLDTKQGKFIFEDDDTIISYNYNRRNSNYYRWDSRIHMLDRDCNMNMLSYSKDIDNEYRFTYIVYKPEINENGEYYCKVEISRCGNHKIGDTKYDGKNTKSTLGDYPDLIKLKTSISNNSSESNYSDTSGDLFKDFKIYNK